MAGSYPNLDIVNINVYIKFDEILSICSQDIARKRKSDINQGHNSVTNMRKMTGSNLNIDLININAHSKFGQILSISSQDTKF